MTLPQARWALGRTLVRAMAFQSRGWPDYSRLLIARDYAGWSLDADAAALRGVCSRIGIRCGSGHWADVCDRQALFLTDQFALLRPDGWRGHRIAFAYFHGRPGSGVAEFDQVYATLRRLHHRIARIQVSHRAMRDLVLETGIDGAKVKLVPIGIDTDQFEPAAPAVRRRVRDALGMPREAFVVGSFQKDGTGWGEGEEPKLIKGPDVFVQTMARIKARIPELMVLLTGPARGYVKRGLTAAGVPFRHVYLRRASELPRMYHALDLYLVSSRQEGGPKAVLESMASGVPIVTTAVGQAVDLVKHGTNGLIADVDAVEALAACCLQVHDDSGRGAVLITGGRVTADQNSLRAQTPLWDDFMRGFVTW